MYGTLHAWKDRFHAGFNELRSSKRDETLELPEVYWADATNNNGEEEEEEETTAAIAIASLTTY